MKTILRTIQTFSKEVSFAIIIIALLFLAVPLIRLFSPTSGTLELGTLHVGMLGVAVYGSALVLTLLTFYIGIRTLWDYAINPNDEEDSKDSFREDWHSCPPAVRVSIFTITYLAVFYLAIHSLTAILR